VLYVVHRCCYKK